MIIPQLPNEKRCYCQVQSRNIELYIIPLKVHSAHWKTKGPEYPTIFQAYTV